MKPGDSITVKFRHTKLPRVQATILSVENRLLRIRYAADAEIFAGLIGLIRLPREKTRT